MQAALVSFLVGTLALTLVTMVQGRPWPSLRALAGIPAWVWTGGILGAFNITATVILAPRLGALNLVMTVVSGQIVTSMLLDHFGLLGFPRLPFNGYRFGGAVLAITGLYLTTRR
jgi:transporter family-2 protein